MSRFYHNLTKGGKNTIHVVQHLTIIIKDSQKTESKFQFDRRGLKFGSKVMCIHFTKKGQVLGG